MYEPRLPLKLLKKDEEITNLVIEIAEMTGMIALTDNRSKNPTLRRENRIHSIHSTLAIERNSLTIDQISDVFSSSRLKS